jgi:hypothetical protein
MQENWIDTVAAIASAVAAIASVVVAIVIWKAQAKQEKQAQQIALFDKRYDIYQESLRIIGFSKFVFVEDDGMTMPNYLLMANMVLTDYDLMKDGYFLTEHIRLQHALNVGSKDDRDKADRDLYYHDLNANNHLLQLQEKTLNVIKSSKFCFDEKIFDALNSCVNAFFLYILIFVNGNSQESERDRSLLKNCLLAIENDKIIERMEEYLSLTK